MLDSGPDGINVMHKEQGDPAHRFEGFLRGSTTLTSLWPPRRLVVSPSRGACI